MDVKDAIASLEASDSFKEWKKKNPSYSLAHIFRMLDEPNENIWQIGYFSGRKNDIVTFIMHQDSISITHPEEAFKDPGKMIKPLDIGLIKLSLAEALEKANEFRREAYKGQAPVKTIVILQNLDSGQVYNITLITDSFKTLNIKVSSLDGEIVSHHLHSLMDFNMKLWLLYLKG